MSDETRTVTVEQLAQAIDARFYQSSGRMIDLCRQNARAIFDALPTSTEGLDVERLAKALYVIWPNEQGWFAEPPWFREKAAAIAAEYARLASLSPSPTEENPE